MHPPLIHTPMMRIGFKKSAILSLAAMTTAALLFTGCKRPVEKADEAVAGDVKSAEGSLAGATVFGQTTAALAPTSTLLSVDVPTANELVKQIGTSGTLTLTGAPAPGGKPVSVTVNYSAVNTLDGHITIAPAGSAFSVGSVVQPAEGYALKVLTRATANTAASPAQKAIADFAAGQAEVLAADADFHQIDEAQNHLERLLGRVAAMALVLQQNNIIIGGLAAKEPTKSLAEIDKTANAANVGEQGVWFASDTAPIPALATIDKSIADLTAGANALKAKHADMEKQRADALVQAEKLSAQSEQAKGKQAVDLYVQSANLRKTASDLSTQMQDLDSQLAANARELAVVTAQQSQLQSALTKFADQKKQVSGGWDSVKKRIDDVAVKSKAIITGDLADAAPTTSPSTNPSEAPAKSLTDAGDQIVQVSADIDKLRKAAKDHLAKADAFFTDAAKFSKEVAGVYNSLLANPNLRESPQRPAWQQTVEIYNDIDPALKRAEVAQRLARLYADDVYYTGSRLAIDKAVQAILSPAEAPVKAVLDQAGIVLPKTLDPGTLNADIDTSKAEATKAFTESETDLDQILGKPSSTETGAALMTAANVTKMIEQYGHWAFARGISDPQADGLLTASKGLADTLSKVENAALPLPLPPEIAPKPPEGLTSGLPTATTTSGTQPSETTQPATQPSTQESPATSPATGPAPDATGTPATAPGATTTPPATPSTTPAAPPDTAPSATSPTPPAAPGDATPPATPPAPPATPAPPGTGSK